jgi:hypothetical protein
MMASHLKRWARILWLPPCLLHAFFYTKMRQPQCADWCAWRARHYPGPFASEATLHPRYCGSMRESCGLHAASTLVS